MNVFQNVLLLATSAFTVVVLLILLLKSQKKSQLKTIFVTILVLLLGWFIGLVLQLLCSNNFNIEPIFFENFVYIFACSVPVVILFLALSFINDKIKFTKKYLLFFIIPIISLLVLWTNNYHHLFYEKYSTNFRETVFGSYFIIHSVYSYACVAIGIVLLLIYSIKNSGLFSKQSVFFALGTSFCLLINVLSTSGILNLSIYATPMSFTIAIICYAIAIFKFDFLNISPIATQRIVDNMSDSYIVLNEDNIIIDFNKTLIDTFELNEISLRKRDIYSLPKVMQNSNLTKEKISNSLAKAKSDISTLRYELYFESINKYFNIEITPIYSQNMFLGTLLLFKDVTQHMQDIKTIKNNQDMLMEKERLASLGQLIGGISHNLKTPIMSISGAAEGLNDLIKEYETSIGDPEVTNSDHHEIAKDMYEWTKKIRSYTEYMSDIITAVKGQAVTLSSDNDVDFTIDELIKRVDILMKHELKTSLITLNMAINVDKSMRLNGDVNSLVQVVNNLISNSIQSYNGQKGNQINLNFEKKDNRLIISVQDFGMGMNTEVKSKLFKEMITTKGKNGSGLGLFMSYSTIKAHFNGDISFESEEGKGTCFYIKIPI